MIELNPDNIIKYDKSAVGSESKTVLMLESKQITFIANNTLQSFADLQEIYLTNNKLSEIPEYLFQNTKQLLVINLSDNQLTALPRYLLQSLTQLREFNVSGNKIIEIDPNFFMNNSKLEAIHLNNNDLEEIPKDLIKKLKNLKRLSLNDNHIIELDVPAMIYSLKITALSIANNELSEIVDYNRFRKCFPKLESISLSGNEITCQKMEAIVESFQQQNIKIEGLDMGSGIQEDCVYGIKCSRNQNFFRTKDYSLRKKSFSRANSIASDDGKSSVRSRFLRPSSATKRTDPLRAEKPKVEDSFHFSKIEFTESIDEKFKKILADDNIDVSGPNESSRLSNNNLSIIYSDSDVSAYFGEKGTAKPQPSMPYEKLIQSTPREPPQKGSEEIQSKLHALEELLNDNKGKSENIEEISIASSSSVSSHTRSSSNNTSVGVSDSDNTYPTTTNENVVQPVHPKMSNASAKPNSSAENSDTSSTSTSSNGNILAEGATCETEAVIKNKINVETNCQRTKELLPPSSSQVSSSLQHDQIIAPEDLVNDPSRLEEEFENLLGSYENVAVKSRNDKPLIVNVVKKPMVTPRQLHIMRNNSLKVTNRVRGDASKTASVNEEGLESEIASLKSKIWEMENHMDRIIHRIVEKEVQRINAANLVFLQKQLDNIQKSIKNELELRLLDISSKIIMKMQKKHETDMVSMREKFEGMLASLQSKAAEPSKPSKHVPKWFNFELNFGIPQ